MSYFVRNQEFAFGIDCHATTPAPIHRRLILIRLRPRPCGGFLAIRAGVSWGYRDPMFRALFPQAQAMGACVLPTTCFTLENLPCSRWIVS